MLAMIQFLTHCHALRLSLASPMFPLRTPSSRTLPTISTKHGTLPDVLVNDVLDGAEVMFGVTAPISSYSDSPPHQPHWFHHVPHVIELRPLGPLLCPLHQIDALNRGAVELEPHLDTDPCDLSSQQESRVHAAPPDVDQHARERLVAVIPAHLEDVAGPDRVAVVPREQLLPRSRGVEDRELARCQVGDRGLAGVCGWWRVGFYAPTGSGRVCVKDV